MSKVIKQIKLVEEAKWNLKYNVIAKNGTLFIRYDVEKLAGQSIHTKCHERTDGQG